jgi:glyoxylase-like metal-dependent hydrolase (beta-lactamase superfamily II)
MNKVKVLIEGFAEKLENYKTVSPSVVLIETGKYKIIIDPGLNRKNLLKALEKENLKTDQIDYVILTHYHLDHSALMGIFEKAIILDDESKYQQNGEISKQKENMLGNEIQIISTPGHDPWHCSVLVKTEDLGNVVVAGDLFWWRNGFEPKKDYKNILNLVDPFVKDQKALIESRKMILEIADWIIPGHGKMFKNLNK